MNRFQKSFWVPMALPRLLWHHTHPSADLTSPPAFVLYTSKREISSLETFHLNKVHSTKPCATAFPREKAFRICGKGSSCCTATVLLDSGFGALMGPLGSTAAPQCSQGSQGCMWFQAHQKHLCHSPNGIRPLPQKHQCSPCS